MTVLVTGGGGFLGRAVVERLLARGARVRSFARGPYPELTARGVDVRRGDLTDAAAVAEAVRGCGLVFHVAARPGVWGRYRDFYLPNVVGTQNILVACRAAGVRRLVYTSSPSVVFNGRDMENVDERVPYPGHYEAHYPKTKAIAERLVLAANGPDLATVALRPHLIWGPGDNHLVPRILRAAGRGRCAASVGRPSSSIASTLTTPPTPTCWRRIGCTPAVPSAAGRTSSATANRGRCGIWWTASCRRAGCRRCGVASHHSWRTRSAGSSS